MTQRRTLNSALVLTPEKRAFIGGDDERPDLESPKQDRVETQETEPLGRQTLVPLTTRIGQQTADALRRAYLQQKLNRRLPDTQQEIVEAALRQWLSEHGLLD